jgi:hypothetical protein
MQIREKHISSGTKIRVQKDLTCHSITGRIKKRNGGTKHKEQNKKKAHIYRGLLQHHKLLIDVG